MVNLLCFRRYPIIALSHSRTQIFFTTWNADRRSLSEKPWWFDEQICNCNTVCIFILYFDVATSNTSLSKVKFRANCDYISGSIYSKKYSHSGFSYLRLFSRSSMCIRDCTNYETSILYFILILNNFRFSQGE